MQFYVFPVGEYNNCMWVLKVRRSIFFPQSIFQARIESLMTLCAHFCHSISSHNHLRAAITFHHILHIYQIQQGLTNIAVVIRCKKGPLTEHEIRCGYQNAPALRTINVLSITFLFIYFWFSNIEFGSILICRNLKLHIMSTK